MRILQKESMKSGVWNKILNFIIEEWQIKLISLFIAILLWFYVNSLSYIEQSFTIPIQYLNLPADLIMLESSDTAASFIIKGRIEKLKNISISKIIKPVVNLENAIPGTKYYKIEIVINEPQSDLIINLQKERVSVKIDRIVSKIVFIQPIISGNPKEGYKIEDIIMDKNLAYIKGPSEVLTQLNYVETKPLFIAGASNDILLQAALNLPKFVFEVSNETYNVSVKITAKGNIPSK